MHLDPTCPNPGRRQKKIPLVETGGLTLSPVSISVAGSTSVFPFLRPRLRSMFFFTSGNGHPPWSFCWFMQFCKGLVEMKDFSPLVSLVICYTGISPVYVDRWKQLRSVSTTASIARPPLSSYAHLFYGQQRKDKAEEQKV
ncbi:hypothetical protein GW17_00006191 [Ensete ventricosum]|nr:hypothetical protein GW17_00006191 [Ensete ventricosum]